jgi:DeoR family fructose operon transcriptional repressor
MIKRERQDSILKIIKQRKYCTVSFLSKQLYVAPITIRRDLCEMEASGLITRCYGGATIPEHENREVPFDLRNTSNASVKETLVKRAAKLIRAGDVVFLDASSTVSRITQHLFQEQNLTVITNSTLVAEKLNEKHVRCYVTGGMSVENSHALVGTIAEKTISGLYANICFFSAQGIDEDGTISDHSEEESALRRLMIENSKEQYFLFDGSKYRKRFAFRICSAQNISGIITDLNDISFKRGK